MLPTPENHPALRRSLTVFALLAVCTACGPATEVLQEGDITGHWFGERWEGSARVQWLVDRRSDGHFEVLFHTCYAGEVVRVETHTGAADFSGGVYRTTIDQIITDGEVWIADSDEDVIVYEYEISKLTATAMHYRSLDFGNRYEVTRVGEDFRLHCPPARQIIDTSPGGRSGRDAWIRRGVTSDDGEAEGGNDDPPGDAD